MTRLYVPILVYSLVFLFIQVNDFPMFGLLWVLNVIFAIEDVESSWMLELTFIEGNNLRCRQVIVCHKDYSF